MQKETTNHHHHVLITRKYSIKFIEEGEAAWTSSWGDPQVWFINPNPNLEDYSDNSHW